MFVPPPAEAELAALRALASEGIQHGHMRLHRRKLEVAAEARGLSPNGGAS